MPNGAPTTMIISKDEKDDSNDSFGSDEASDLSVQLGMCGIVTVSGKILHTQTQQSPKINSHHSSLMFMLHQGFLSRPVIHDQGHMCGEEDLYD